jgi:hypothetical protein
MHPNVDPAIGNDKRPHNKNPYKKPVGFPKKMSKEYGDRKRIGGMGREIPKLPSTRTFNESNESGKIRVITGPEPPNTNFKKV